MENDSGRAIETPVRLLDSLDPGEMGLTLTPDSRRLVSVDEDAEDQGYDSDGNLGPFFNQVEMEDDYEMDHEGAIESSTVDRESTPSQTPSDNPTYCTFTEDEIKKMRVPEMRKYLKEKYGVKSSGMKQKELREK